MVAYLADAFGAFHKGMQGPALFRLPAIGPEAGTLSGGCFQVGVRFRPSQFAFLSHLRRVAAENNFRAVRHKGFLQLPLHSCSALQI